jgi:glyoxylase-like metal-dependent hydrolase (beta-lactamase superfamily II)
VSSSDEPRLIDVHHLGRERVIGCWEIGGALVDPGPESCIETLLGGLRREPHALLLTHIHLDHAGASGALVERFPSLEVWVHERGAPHLSDPSRLIKSAERLYGYDMDRLWGRVVPVPEANLRILRGGERIEVGGRRIEVSYAPGHASHHVVYLDRTDETSYVGDVAGVRIPPADFVLPPTPPPDIDLEAWYRSIDKVAAARPAQLALTHFGVVGEVEGHLARMREALQEQGERARRLLDSAADEEEGAGETFIAETRRRVREKRDSETASVYEQAAPPEQLWLGLKRYWEKLEVATGPS